MRDSGMKPEIRTDGYMVLHGVIPVRLLQDLRVGAEHARKIARDRFGPQAQRLAPIWNFDIDLGPFRDFADLPVISVALERQLSASHVMTVPENILFEPMARSYRLPWHRDPLWIEGIAPFCAPVI